MLVAADILLEDHQTVLYYGINAYSIIDLIIIQQEPEEIHGHAVSKSANIYLSSS